MTDMHLPASRLYNLGRIVTNISENYKARAFLMKNRGAVGILSNGSGDKFGYVPMSPGERNEVQQDFRKNYNLNSSDWNIIISNKTLTWTPMSYPIKDLMMTEQEEHDIKTICDALGYPHPLLARGANTSFNNQITSERTLYQNAIIPESLNYDLQINGMLEAQKGGIIWGYDFSHLPVLQSDMLLNERTSSIKTSRIKMQWMMGAITYNQMLLELDLEPVSNGDYYYIESQEYKDSIMPKTANNGQ